MAVSIIVPVYRNEWLTLCIDSIKAQTYKDIELIVIDDHEGTGAWAARNRGLDKATGDYVMFCDADDYMEPDAVEKMIGIDADLVCGSFRKFGDFDATVSHPNVKMDMKQLAAYVMMNLRNPMANQMLSGCWAKLYRRSLVGRFPPLTTAEDMAFNFDYLRLCKSVAFTSHVVYNNRKHSGTLSTTFDEKNKPGLFGFLGGLKYVHRFLSRFYGADEIEDAIDNSKVYHSMLYFSRICQQTGLPMREALMRLYQ